MTLLVPLALAADHCTGSAAVPLETREVHKPPVSRMQNGQPQREHVDANVSSLIAQIAQEPPRLEGDTMYCTRLAQRVKTV